MVIYCHKKALLTFYMSKTDKKGQKTACWNPNYANFMHDGFCFHPSFSGALLSKYLKNMYESVTIVLGSGPSRHEAHHKRSGSAEKA
jgi:hypothetical protein